MEGCRNVTFCSGLCCIAFAKSFAFKLYNLDGFNFPTLHELSCREQISAENNLI